jgi:hypothetical protein
MAVDYYVIAHQISSNLLDENQEDWAQRIEDAIAHGSTGTEILMHLRWTLQQFKAAKVDCSSTTRRLVDELLCELKIVLK